ncbi:hypothetical protein LshimejAT787_1302320 [Lyophyllum shimeji]|uniref:Uncharacterized protein n=1 Tax=Lyophyllum shimeji TaxID=47721 RepID=A0A9P3UUN8_LYOSH|nr:hypothetical protein LshimejAT787_1302320 [Lyophyllum shimeji]
MSRPQLAAPPVGPKFTINVPANWYAITTAISRKPYAQGCAVSYDFFVRNTRMFGSEPGQVNEQMKITLDKATSLPLVAQEDDYQLDFAFYHSAAPVKSAEELAQKNALSNKVHVVQAAKLPGSYAGADNVTFFVFVEDTSSQEANTGQFDDAVATIHFVQK